MTRDELIAALEKAPGPDRRLDAQIYRLTDPIIERCWPYWNEEQRESMTPRFTGDLMAAITRVPKGFYWTCGLCELSGHVTIGPDYNSKDRQRLLTQWPEAQFHEGFSEDLQPGDGIHRVCIAICIASLKASAQP